MEVTRRQSVVGDVSHRRVAARGRFHQVGQFQQTVFAAGADVDDLAASLWDRCYQVIDDVSVSHESIHRLIITDITNHQFTLWIVEQVGNVAATSHTEIVHDGDVMTSSYEDLGQMRADESGTTRDQSPVALAHVDTLASDGVLQSPPAREAKFASDHELSVM